MGDRTKTKIINPLLKQFFILISYYDVDVDKIFMRVYIVGLFCWNMFVIDCGDGSEGEGKGDGFY